MKILFFGDIVGKIGRRAITKVLPEIRQEVDPDLIIANGENLAHGNGVTAKTLQEMLEAGVEFFTSGNHIFDKPEVEEILTRQDSVLLRPLNYPAGTPGQGVKLVEIGPRKVAIVNLLGRVFMGESFNCPFRALDEVLQHPAVKKASAIIVDFHAEATSEKLAFGWHAAGRVAAVLGTHTHIPTADARILPPGTAYISDVGMVGAADSVIGVGKEAVIKEFLTQRSQAFLVPEEGEVIVNAVVVEIDPKTGRAKKIERLDKKVKV